MIVGIHGIRCFRYLEEAGTAQAAADAMAVEWAAAVGKPYDQGDLRVAYYAPMLHLGTGQGPEQAESLPPSAQRMMLDWVTALGAPDEVAMGRGSLPVRQAAGWIAARFGDTAKRFAVVFCREVDTYFSEHDSARGIAVREEVHRVLTEERPRAVLAHSLGSVVAYELLWQHPVEIDLLVTLGSPLGMPNVVFERLALGKGNAAMKGQRPPAVKRWVNIADPGDIVAIPRDLPSRFPGIDAHYEVSIGLVASHKATRYLARPEVADELGALTRFNDL